MTNALRWLAVLCLLSGCSSPGATADASLDVAHDASTSDGTSLDAASTDVNAVEVLDTTAPADANLPDGPDAGPGQPGRLRASGGSILAPDGTPILLRGYSWGAWGTAQPADGMANAMEGANCVRIPLRWWGNYGHPNVDSYLESAPGHINPVQLGILDDMIGQATRAGLWVILFLDSNSGQGSDDNPATGTFDDFWHDPTKLAEFHDAWEFLVQRYRNYPFIAAYELLPEPRHTRADGTYGADVDAEVRTFYEGVVPHIRAWDTRTPVVMGPNDSYNSGRLEDAYTSVDGNIIYTIDYFLFTTAGLNHVTDMQTFRTAHSVPVWVNQVGVESGRAMADTYANMALSALNAQNIGWAWWTYRLDSMNGAQHGIYYLAADGVTWILKPTWLALVDSYF